MVAEIVGVEDSVVSRRGFMHPARDAASKTILARAPVNRSLYHALLSLAYSLRLSAVEAQIINLISTI